MGMMMQVRISLTRFEVALALAMFLLEDYHPTRQRGKFQMRSFLSLTRRVAKSAQLQNLRVGFPRIHRLEGPFRQLIPTP